MKAANLLISNTGNLMIADFGLARCFDYHSSLSVPYSNGGGQHPSGERGGGGGIRAIRSTYACETVYAVEESRF